ncbi:Ubiquitination network signaling protein acrB [Golovinomyces cichoracearum]|uniref:Ubiquitination network signaling protein acrB n=1 Tax=Golovinomyces cichoracearum TaxID=62708 RepID=A0A420IHB8_9PEZI|nr:Ubiquitination network signaling protein acrB [Golovinomyces cichoracearum]
MPRGSTTTKRVRGAAVQAGTRHENGAVAASPKSHKPKRNSQANDSANTLQSTSTTPSPPTTPLSMADKYEQYMDLNETRADYKLESDLKRMNSASYSESSTEPYLDSSDGLSHENHRQIDVNAAKNPAVHRDLSPLGFTLTILRSCPLSDTLAILIVLLQIPPTFLSMIQILFAALTFVPSSSIATSGLTLTHILQGTINAPSLAAIFFLDICVLLLWLIFWSPVQYIVLDLAQAVIALTLGGGSSYKETGLKNVLWCFGIIGASHFVRTGNVKSHGFPDFISSSLTSNPDLDDPLEPTIRNNGKKFGLIRIVLAIHILTQGAARYVRDWYLRRENRDFDANFGDPEAGEVTIDPNIDLALSQTVENENSTLPETSNVTFISKKKINCAQIRNHQPLWAALASTKIVMVKEYETSHAAAESAGTNATDMNNLGNAPFSSEADKIWITFIGSGQIFFSTSFFSEQYTNVQDKAVVLENSSIDITKPFYVKVNKSIWQPTKIYHKADPDKATGTSTRWSGEILGLAPMSYYECEFFSTVDKSLLFSTSIRTLQPPTVDHEISTAAKNCALPSSPHSTLKASIAQATKIMNEEIQRQKNARKDHRAKINVVRKESERLLGAIGSTGGNDDKMRQKSQQSTLHMKQADEAAALLISQIENIDNTPKNELSLYSESKSEIQSQRDKHKKVLSDINSSKQNAEREIQALKSDLSNLRQKTEARKQRLHILNSRHENVLESNAKVLDEAQRREVERDLKRKERANIQAFYTERLHSITSQICEGQTAYQTVVSAIENLLRAQQDMYQRQSPTVSSPNLSGLGNDSVPVNPNLKPVNYPWVSPINSSNASSGSGSSPLTSSAISTSKPGYKSRGRSSSLLSNISKFTQSSDERSSINFIKKKPPGYEDSLEDPRHSSGSLIGSGSGTASFGELKIPAPVKSLQIDSNSVLVK